MTVTRRAQRKAGEYGYTSSFESGFPRTIKTIGDEPLTKAVLVKNKKNGKQVTPSALNF